MFSQNQNREDKHQVPVDNPLNDAVRGYTFGGRQNLVNNLLNIWGANANNDVQGYIAGPQPDAHDAERMHKEYRPGN